MGPAAAGNTFLQVHHAIVVPSWLQLTDDGTFI